MKNSSLIIFVVSIFLIGCKKEINTNKPDLINLKVERTNRNTALISWDNLNLDSNCIVYLHRELCPLVQNDTTRSFENYSDYSKVYSATNFNSMRIDRNTNSFIDSTFELSPNIFYYLEITDLKTFTNKSRIVKFPMPDFKIFSSGEPRSIKYDREENRIYIIDENHQLINYRLSDNSITSVQLDSYSNFGIYMGTHNGNKELYILKDKKIEIRDAISLEFKELIDIGFPIVNLHSYSEKYWLVVSSTGDLMYILNRSDNTVTQVERPNPSYPYYGITQIFSIDTSLYIYYDFQLSKFDINKEGKLSFNKIISLYQYTTNSRYATDYYFMKSSNTFYCTLGLEINRDLGINSTNKYKSINSNIYFDDINTKLYQSIDNSKKIICYDVIKNMMVPGETKYSLSHPLFLFRNDGKLKCIDKIGNDYCIEDIN
jgi:hypothetical protein